jgi:hypothetical protein
MADAEEFDAYAVNEELKALKIKYRKLEVQSKESQQAGNKGLGELKSLRDQCKNWVKAAANVYSNLFTTTRQILVGMNLVDNKCDIGITKAEATIAQTIKDISKVKEIVINQQLLIQQQAEDIAKKTKQIDELTLSLKDALSRLKALSDNDENEAEKLNAPMREKVTKAMFMLMKEKAQRGQEKREICDLWPMGYLMPTILMKYRTLDESERVTRLKMAQEKNASTALSIEIKANLYESKQWESRYNEYGIEYHYHTKTGESRTEKPAIIDYKPPIGRDDMGNSTDDDNILKNWIMKTDFKGKTSYQNIETKEISMMPPTLYYSIPDGRSSKDIVRDAANTVLTFIKSKIMTHINLLKIKKDLFDNPVCKEDSTVGTSSDDDSDGEKTESANESNKEPTDTVVDTGEDLEDLSVYMYDIETIELLAEYDPREKNESTQLFVKDRSFMDGSEIRAFGGLLAEHLESPMILGMMMMMMFS